MYLNLDGGGAWRHLILLIPKDISRLRKVWRWKKSSVPSSDRYQCGWLANQRRIGKYCPSDGSGNADPFRRPTGSRSILHSRHQYHWHTGYVPPITVAAPHLGAWMAKVLGPKNEVVPPFINIGQRLEGVGEKEELKAFTTAGFFGSEFGPMNLPYPEQAVKSVQPPEGMEPGRFSNRYKHFKKLLDQNPNRELMSDFQRNRCFDRWNRHTAFFNPRKRTPLTSPSSL